MSLLNVKLFRQVLLFIKYYSSDQINKNEVGWTCSMFWARCMQGFGADT